VAGEKNKEGGGSRPARGAWQIETGEKGRSKIKHHREHYIHTTGNKRKESGAGLTLSPKIRGKNPRSFLPAARNLIEGGNMEKREGYFTSSQEYSRERGKET